MPTWIALTFLALVAVGFLLVVLGWRGRRINDHPVCKQCRFDLDGIHELITCPECGAGLKRPGSTRRGVRKRMWSVVTVGALMVLLPGSAIGVVLFAALTGVDSAAYKPVWLLTFEARHGGIAQVKAAGAELLARDQQGKLSDAERASAIETGLWLQADQSRPWDPASWGDLIDRAIANDDLTDEQAIQFLSRSFTLKFLPRKVVKVGGLLPVVVEVGQSRAGTATQFVAALSGVEANANGTTLQRATLEQMQTLTEERVIQPGRFGYANQGPFGFIYCYGAAFPTAGGPLGGGVVNLYVPEDLSGGLVSVDLLVYGSLQRDIQNGIQITSLDEERRDFEGSTSFEVEVRPKGERMVELIEPTDTMRKSVRDVLASTVVEAYSYDQGVTMLQMQSSVDELDVGVAFYVTGTWDDKTVRLGIITNGKNQPDMSAFGAPRVFGGQTMSDEVPESITLTFEPAEWAAAGTVDLTSIYGEKIVIEDVGIGVQSGYITRAVSTSSQTDEEDADDP